MEIKPFEKKVWLSSPTMHGEEIKYITEAYETNWMSTIGENINEVERLAAEKVGCKYAVALSCGTAALHLCMKIAGIKCGDFVFCSDMTFGRRSILLSMKVVFRFSLIQSGILGIWILWHSERHSSFILM
jgi:cystathionine beta-lyase/cystathionine gamma-synthase